MPDCSRRSALRMITAAAVISSPATTVAAASDGSPQVIEMFTSQGCSSCPPADKLLKSFTGRNDVIVLSFHVDYWDRLAWKDTFGSPAYTQRQQAYARRRGDGQVYTPQAVINDLNHEVGHNRAAIERHLASAGADPGRKPTTVGLSLRGGSLLVQISGRDGRAPPSGTVVTLLGVQSQGSASATRGENAGQTLAYVNIVRAMRPLGSLSGGRFDGAVPTTDTVLTAGDAAVVLVQASADGAILGAARLQLR